MSQLNLNNMMPKGIPLRYCQRFDSKKLCGNGKVPIPFIPTRDELEEGEEVTKVKVYITKDIQKYVEVFKDGDVESIIRHIKRHEGILDAKKLQATFDANTRALAGARQRLNLMGADDDERDELVMEIETLQRSLVELPSTAFDYMEQLLDESLHAEWQKVVTKVCESTTYVDNNGVETINGAARGKTFEMLKVCYLEMVKWSTKQNAAELHRAYISTCVKMPPPEVHPVTAAQYITRMEDCNSYLTYLPCLKQVRGSPTNMARADVPFTDTELCSIILSGLDIRLTTAYWALKGSNHVPTSVVDLKNDLESIEPQVELARNSKSSGKKDASKSGDNGKQNSGKRKAAPSTDSGPRKTNNSKGYAKTKKQRLCQKCAKHSPAIKNTHNTADCRKWDDNGNAMDGYKGKRTHNNVSNHQMKEMVAMFSQALDSAKDRKRKSGKSTRSNKRQKNARDNRYLTSDDESMDSNSS